MIEVSALVVRYGLATALSGIDLIVHDGEMVALVGPNGAGKSTLVNTLTRIIKPASGSVAVEGRLVQVPEGRQLFGKLSVDDNLRLGAWRSGNRDTARIYEVLPKLRDIAHRQAHTLSGGEQQMVAVGRALMADPDMLAIDELSLGLAPSVTRDLAEHLVQLNRQKGTAVLLVEQNAHLAFRICSRAYVLESGRVVAEGPSAQIAGSAEIARAYLGGLAG